MSALVVAWSLYHDPPSAGATPADDYAAADIDLARVVAVMQGEWRSRGGGGRSFADTVLVLDSGVHLRSPIDFEEARREWRERLGRVRGEIAGPRMSGAR